MDKHNLNKREILERVKQRQITSEQALQLLTELKNDRARTAESAYFKSVWEQKEESLAGEGGLSGRYLVFDTDEVLSSAWKEYLAQQGQHDASVMLVKPGETFRSCGNDVYELNPVNPDEYRQLADVLRGTSGQPLRIIHMWSKDPFDGQEDALKHQLHHGVYSLFHFVQALIGQGVKDKTQLLYVYSYSEQDDQPQYAGVGGFAKTLQLEDARFAWKAVGVKVPDIAQSAESAVLVDLLNREFKADPAQTEVRYDNGTRLVKGVQELQPQDREGLADLPVKEQGVYLITGGAGGLGLIFAEHLAKQGKPKLVLVGRSQPDERKQAKFRELATHGAEVLYLQADLTKQANVQRVVEQIREQYQTLDGVIHGAGVIRDAFIIKKKIQEIDEVLAPKVCSTVFLDEATRDCNLDFFVMFSSITSTIGNLGQSDYAYGNGFMDHYAVLRSQRGHGKTVAINWPLWAEGGMHISEEELEQFIEHTGTMPLPTEHGVRALEEALKSDLPQFVVTYGDLPKVRQVFLHGYAKQKAAPAPVAEAPVDVDPEILAEKIEQLLLGAFSDLLKLPEDRIDTTATFQEYGVDSIMIKKFNQDIGEKIASTPKTLLFEYETLEEVKDYFVQNHPAELVSLFGLGEQQEAAQAELHAAASEVAVAEEAAAKPLTPWSGQPNTMLQPTDEAEEEIAIIGLSGRYPGAANFDEFWDKLANGQDSIGEIPSTRWDWTEHYDPDPEKAKEGKSYSKWGAFLEEADTFDPLFFNISPKEAEEMDPQERMFLQSAWEVLEDAGYTRKQLLKSLNRSGRGNVGVFAGVTSYTYSLWGPDQWQQGNAVMPGSLPWTIANRVSFVFNFNGPSVPVDTACASSLTAIHMACESLKKRECQVAIAGGVNLYLHPSKYVYLCQKNMLSATGKCHTFGSGADGFVPGEGVGAVLLKPLKQAIADGDHIYGVIKGTAINHGGSTNGYTVPSPKAQAELIADVMEKAGINARTISYIEAHGTGTSLGDPIEITGLGKAFGEHTSDRQFCSIGSVKTNIGHLESAAGIAGLTKVLLQMKHKKLAPTLNAETYNPNIDFERTPFYVQHSLEEWKQPTVVEDGVVRTYPRRAGISSFGAGGANAHILIEEYVQPGAVAAVEQEGPRVFVLSARDEDRLREYAGELADFLKRRVAAGEQDLTLDNVAYTMQVGREAMSERLAAVVSTMLELLQLLDDLHVGNVTNAAVFRGQVLKAKPAADVVQQAIAAGNWTGLAELWATGTEVEWSLLYQGNLPQRVSLPTYPFETERYWIREVDASGAGEFAKLHPLVGGNVSTLQEQKFTTRLTGREFFLADHVIGGQKILPGVAYLEMARAAAEIAGERKVCRIQDAYWAKPIVVADHPVNVTIGLYPDGESIAYEVSVEGPEGQRPVHAGGRVSFNEPANNQAVAEFVDLESLRARCTKKVQHAEDFYKGYENRGFNFGPRFQGLQTVYVGNDEALGRLRLPAGLEGALADYVLHPTLLDGSLQTSSGLLEGEEAKTTYVPFTIGEIEVFHALPQTCYSHVVASGSQAAGMRSFNVTVLGEDGLVLARVKDFIVREFKQGEAKEAAASTLYFVPEWEDAPVQTEAQTGSASTVVVFDATGEVANALSEHVAGKAEVVLVTPGEGYKQVGEGHYEVHPTRFEDYAHLLESLAAQGKVPEKFLHAWSADEQSLTDSMERGIYSLLTLSQALMKQKTKKNVRLVSLYPAHVGATRPELEAVIGFAKTLRRENPRFFYKTVEIVSSSPTLSPVKAAETAWREFGIDDGMEVRVENEVRYVLRMQEHEVGQDRRNPSLLTEQGVYLITGGVGGLGLIFAEHLAKTYRAKLVLTGRSALDAGKKQHLADMERLGAEVLYLQADVAKYSDVEQLVAEARARFGKLNGILHSAGVLRDALVIKKTREEMEAVLAPKVFGTLNLDRATQGDALDFFVMFSSLASAMGNVAQSDYAYANSFMDSFARLKTKQGKGRYLALNWPLWKSGGMQVDAQTKESFIEQFGMEPLRTENGLAAFETALAASMPQVMVIEGDAKRIRKAILPVDTRETDPVAVANPTVEAADQTQLRKQTETFLKEILSDELRLPAHKIKAHEALEHYGLDSIMVMALTRTLEKHFGVLPKTLFFEYQNLADLAGYFMESQQAKLLDKLGVAAKSEAPKTQAQTNQPARKEPAPAARSRYMSQSQPVGAHVQQQVQEDIAIIGVSGTYPMANDLDEFLDNLRQGRDCITEVPPERWNHQEYYDPDKNKKGKTYAKWGGFINDVDKFDPLFFNISPREAEIMDPQERLFLQTAWHTLEDGGFTKEQLSQSTVGVYVGVMYGHYQMYGAEETLRGNVLALSSSYAQIANRVSYCLNFNGPSVALDTMCSSSLTAIHFACDSLRRGETDVAIAGGVNVSIHSNKYIQLAQGKFASSDGRCRSFGEGGDGYVPGEGVGAVLLKPLSKAIADGNHIYAVIKGSSINHGGKTNGFTVPSPTAQGKLIADALKKAHINPRTISYVEAHGTGTSLGDPIEIAGLTKVFGEHTKDTQFCAIGSAKSVIGHLESAAGIAAVTKVLLQMKHKQLMPSIHSDTLNPNIDFENSPFRVQHKLEEWKRPVIRDNGIEKEVPRRASISSFGAGGSNAHLILEEYEMPTPVVGVQEDEPQLIVLSAKNKERLRAYADKMLRFLRKSIIDVTVEDHTPARNQAELQQIQSDLLSIASALLGVDENQIDLSENFDDFGFDPLDLNRFFDLVNERFEVSISLDEMLQAQTFDTFIAHLQELTQDKTQARVRVGATSGVSLTDMAYTLQTGREAMEERLALAVTTVEELIERLSDYVQGGTELPNVYRGNVNNDRERLEFLIDGKAGEDFVHTILEQRDLRKLAALWVAGAEFDWNLLHADGTLVRTSLPVYPFAKERYWVPNATGTQSISRGAIDKLHPLIDRNISDLKEQKYTTRFTGQDYSLADHKVAGHSILPGAAYLEIARAAAELAGDATVQKLKNIVWWKAAALDDRQGDLGQLDVSVSLYPAGDVLDYELWSMADDGTKTVQGQGQLEFASDAASEYAAEFLDLPSIEARSSDMKGREEFYSEFEQAGFVYGSSFRPIQKVIGNGAEYLAYMEIPAQRVQDFADYALHPTLIDGAFQSVSMFTRTLDRQATYLPFALGEVEILAPLTETCRAYLQESSDGDAQIRKFDIQIADEQGRVLVKLKDFSVREARESRQNLLYYRNEWQQTEPITATAHSVTGNVLLFDTNQSQAFAGTGVQLVRVKPGTAFQEIGSREYEINPASMEDYKRLIQTLKQQGFAPDQIVHLWSQEPFDTAEAALRSQQERGVYSLLYLSQALMEHHSRSTVGIVYAYTTDGEVQPAYAALSGFAKTLRQENPNLVCKTLEVSGASRTSLLQLAMQELTVPGDVEVRYENGVRYVNRLEPFEATPGTNNHLPLKDGGVYVITGGAGGLGLVFAEHLAGRVQSAKLVLTGRSPLSPDKQQKLQELAQNGAGIVYEQADVTKRDDVMRLAADIKARFGEVNGILHSAGVLRDSFVMKKTQQEMDTVLAPKVYGTVYLEQAMGGDQLDFYVMFSSITSLIGNVGQVDYAYGNGFMDHFAARMAARKPATRYLSINWPLWEEGGMGIEEGTKQWLAKTMGMVPLRTENGIKALEDGLTTSLSQMLVMEGDADKFQSYLNPPQAIEQAEEPQQVELATDQKSHLKQKTVTFLQEVLSETLRMSADRINPKEPLENYGIDSVMIMELTRDLEIKFGELSKTLFFEYQNINDLATYFVDKHRGKLTEYVGGDQQPVKSTPSMNNVPKAVVKKQTVPASSRSRFVQVPAPAAEQAKPEPLPEQDDIAIIGVSGRYPMAENLTEFWENFKAGRDCVSEIPRDRWNFEKDYDPDKNKEGKTYSKWGGFIKDVDKFDPLFFNISPKEAELLDPQERLFLQTVWHTVEDSGYTREHLSNSVVGVYVGVMYGHYQLYGAEESLRGNVIALNSSFASIANRVSYVFNFHGPSMAVDTMCSSSLTAIHLACESLHRGESEVAVAGGVNVSIHPNKYILLGNGKFLSTDGRCRSFGAGGDGYVPGEGVGAVLLKPLKKAIADGDRIYGVIKSSVLNHGGKTNGYSVPNPTEQGNLIAEAMKKTNINPRTISYVEAHGTGTPLGDPIEINGLVRAYSESTADKQYCAIGSAKSNIGHLESAAGIAGVTKILLQFRHQQLAPSLHSETLNPHINFQHTPFYVQQELAEWKRPVIVENGVETEVPRRASISSFGAGGSNAHLILEEYQPSVASSGAAQAGPQLILLSARNEEALSNIAAALSDFLQQAEHTSLADIAYTLQTGREAMEERLALLVSSVQELQERLTIVHEGRTGLENAYRCGLKARKQKMESLLNGATEEEQVEQLMQDKNLRELAEIWAYGASVDWSLLYTEATPQRIELPVYPFAKERYWVPGADSARTTVLDQVEKLHPLLDRNVSDLEEQKYATRLTEANFVMADHKIDGRHVLPGAAYLEMARAAGSMAGRVHGRVQKLKNIVWWKTAALEPIQGKADQLDVSVSLYSVQGAVDYEVWSAGPDGTKTIHGQGQLVFETGGEHADERLDLHAIRARSAKSKGRDDFYREFAASGFAYGPGFQSITEVIGNETEALGRMELPEQLANSFDEYVLHPTLVDGAFQTVSMLIQQETDRVYLPFALGEVDILAPMTPVCFAYVRETTAPDSDIRKFDIQIVNEQGDVMVRLQNFSVRAFQKSAEEQAEVIELLQKLVTDEISIEDAEQLIGVMLHG